MDLRVKKTRRAIRGAFYALLQEKPFEKITVKDITERAEINKTTFYAHYDTIYDLVDQLEEETVTTIVERMEDARMLLTDPRNFVLDLAKNLEEARLPFSRLPSAGTAKFAQHLLAAIQQYAKEENIDTKQYEAIGAILIFLVNGLLALQNQAPELTQQHLDAIADLVAGGIGAVQPGQK